MAQKKSFFDKLTGSVKMTESLDTDETTPKAEPVESEYEEPAEKPEKKTVQIKPVVEEKFQSKEAYPAKEQNESYGATTEGQLTIDVYQTPNEIVIKSTIAGVKPEDLDITITNDMVTVKGSRSRDEEIKDEDYFYQECYWGAFSRSVLLPVEVEADKSTAHIKNGILTLRLPKSEKLKVKKIKVKGD
jgi:HSP20 family protein